MELVQRYAAVGWIYAKLVAFGAAVAAGCCSTSKLGFYALSSSKNCTIVLLEAGQASPCLFGFEAGEGKLRLSSPF